MDYSRNQRICLFDNVRLVNAPSQSVTYEENLSGSASIFGTAQTIKERVTVHDGLYTTVEEKNSAYDVVRRTVTDLDGNSFVSVFAYDSAHRMVRSQNERKMMTEYTYNGKGMQTSAKSYYWDTFNPNVQREELIANEYFKNETSYDSTGEFATGVSDARSEDIKTSNSYNTVKGLLVNTTTPNGQTTSYTYDASTDLVTGVRAVVGDATYSVVYGYQERKLSSITHGGFAYGFTYDGMGRAKKVTIAGTDYTENEYALGETTTVTTSYAGGEKMRVETDRHEQPVKRTYTDKNGVETVIAEGEYDSLGKPVKVLDKITQKEYTYTYDGYENVTAEKVNGLAYKEYEYDGQNRLKKTTFHMGDETQTYRPIYDTRASDGAVYADNAVVGVTLDGVFTSKAEQDDWGRVTKKNLTTTGSTTPLLSEEYSYLDVAVGFETRLTTMVQLLTRKVKGVTKDTLRYTYDNNGNITAIRNGPGTEYYAKYTYDGLNQLTREDNAVLGKSWVFAYDTAGNILSKKEYAYTTGTLGAVLDTKTYTYAATGWKDRLTSFNGEAIAYDALGNPTTYRGHALTWGRIRQLESYRIDSNTLLTFAYDASGLRIRKGATTYQLDGSRILSETRPTGTVWYYYDNGGICGFKYNNVRYYYEKNLQGDITAVYDENGTLKAQYVYDAWGNHTITVNIDGIAILNPFRYRGYYYDVETGLCYLNSRYYDPQTGKFINADTLNNLKGSILLYNLFAYCINSPVIYKDSLGQTPALALAGGGYVAAGLATGSANFWNPVGWVILGGVALAAIGLFAYSLYASYKASASLKDKTLSDVKARKQEGDHYYLAYINQYGALIKMGDRMSFVEALAMLGITGATNNLSNTYQYNREYSSDAQRLLEHKGSGNWGIYADTQGAAKALAVVFGYNAKPEVHGSGMYGHYHDSTHTFHIWYGGVVTY